MEAIKNFLNTYQLEFQVYAINFVIVGMHFMGALPHFFLLIIAGLVASVTVMFVDLFLSTNASDVTEFRSFSMMLGFLLTYSCALFVFVSELLMLGVAKLLTRKVGKNWIKGMDYIYLALGSIGVAAALNRIDFVTDRPDRINILAPLLLASALVIRVIKTRAEIGGWNEPDFVPSRVIKSGWFGPKDVRRDKE